MIYYAIGLMSGSSLDGIDLVFVKFIYQHQKWNFKILHSNCYSYEAAMKKKLLQASKLKAFDYLVFNNEYGKYLGKKINQFRKEFKIKTKNILIASHGHTVFHAPEKSMTAQIGDGAAIAAVTKLTTIYDLRSMDIALGGQGAPVVPIGEKYLFPKTKLFLNIGGIANLAIHDKKIIGFDVCPANRVLNMLAIQSGKEFDEDGILASKGKLDKKLFDELNDLPYYAKPIPKSLANEFGTDVVYKIINKKNIPLEDKLRTMSEHIVFQIKKSLNKITNQSILVTGGGALNKYLIHLLQKNLSTKNIQVILPGEEIIQYKEALIMAFMGVLCYRKEPNILSSVTGSEYDNISGKIIFQNWI